MSFPYTFPITFELIELVTTKGMSILCTIITPSNYSCTNESMTFPLSYAFEADRPNKRFHTQNTNESTIWIRYNADTDALMLCNVNFSSFKINDINVSSVQDKDSGVYNSFLRISYKDYQVFKITIPNQSTVNNENFFAIGSIIGGARIDLNANPQYELNKNLIENIFEKRFIGQNREVREIGRPYHLLDFNWNAISSSNFSQIEDIMRIMGQDEAGGIYEKWSDYEASYLCQLDGDFPFSMIKDFYRHPLRFRELI